MDTLLTLIKKALLITTDQFDTLLTGYYKAAQADLELVGIPEDSAESTTDDLIIMAVITYVQSKMTTGTDSDRFKASYDEQKKQLISSSSYGLSED